MYNYKLLRYADGTVQSRFYSHMVYTGEREIKNRREYVNNPFDGERAEVVYDFDELEKREIRAKQVSRSRTIQNIYNYARANKWDFFVTLTFNQKKVRRFDYTDCQKHLTAWLNSLRKRYPDMKYLMVPEFHMGNSCARDENGNYAYHFHGLMSGIDEEMTFSGHFAKRDGEPIYNIGNYRLGWSTATEVRNQEACSKYITKYVTKELCEATKGRKRYWVSRNCEKPAEEVLVLEATEKAILYDELLHDATSVKFVEVDTGLDRRMIVYVENPNFTIPSDEMCTQFLDSSGRSGVYSMDYSELFFSKQQL